MNIYSIFKIGKQGAPLIRVGVEDRYTLKELEDSIFCIACDSSGKVVFHKDLGFGLGRVAYEYYKNGDSKAFEVIKNLLINNEHINSAREGFVRDKLASISMSSSSTSQSIQ